METYDDLKHKIRNLELQQSIEGKLLKQQVGLMFESMKPINLIKTTVKEFSQSKPLKEGLLNTSIGLIGGYLVKSLFEGSTHNPIKKMLGTALMLGVTNLVAKHPNTVSAVQSQLEKLVSKGSMAFAMMREKRGASNKAL